MNALLDCGAQAEKRASVGRLEMQAPDVTPAATAPESAPPQQQQKQQQQAETSPNEKPLVTPTSPQPQPSASQTVAAGPAAAANAAIQSIAAATIATITKLGSLGAASLATTPQPGTAAPAPGRGSPSPERGASAGAAGGSKTRSSPTAGLSGSLPRAFSTATLNQIFAQIRPHQFTNSSLIDSEIQKIVTLLLRDYVSSWFSVISDNDEFMTELIRTIAHMVRECEHRLLRVDWVALASRDIPEALCQHIRDYRSCCEKLGTTYAGGRSLEDLFHGCQPHIALNDPISEREYLRRVAELLLDILLPEHEFRSESIRYLLREIVTNTVLAVIIDMVADPDYLNQLILKLLEPEEFEETPTTEHPQRMDHHKMDSTRTHRPQTDDTHEAPLASDIEETPSVSDFEDARYELSSHRDNSHGRGGGLGDHLRTRDARNHSDHFYHNDGDRSRDRDHQGLFRVRDMNNPFARNRRRKQSTITLATSSNPFVRFTMGRLEKMTNSIDKLRNLVGRGEDGGVAGANDAEYDEVPKRKTSSKRSQRRKQKALENDREFEGQWTSGGGGTVVSPYISPSRTQSGDPSIYPQSQSQWSPSAPTLILPGSEYSQSNESGTLERQRAMRAAPAGVGRGPISQPSSSQINAQLDHSGLMVVRNPSVSSDASFNRPSNLPPPISLPNGAIPVSQGASTMSDSEAGVSVAHERMAYRTEMAQRPSASGLQTSVVSASRSTPRHSPSHSQATAPSEDPDSLANTPRAHNLSISPSSNRSYTASPARSGATGDDYHGDDADDEHDDGDEDEDDDDVRAQNLSKQSRSGPPLPIDPTLRPEIRFYNQLMELWSFSRDLYRDTKSGPRHLGPIDTTKYDRYHLEEPVLDLLSEAFQIHTQQRWTFTQFMFFVKPVLHSFVGPMINRAIIKSIYFLICEEQISNYLLLFRLMFWPNNYPAPNYGVRSDREKQETKAELESHLVQLIGPILAPLLGQTFAEERTRFLLNAFQHKAINKHLIFVFLDLVLVHLAPEYAEPRVSSN